MKNWLCVIIGAFFISIGLYSCSEEKEQNNLYSIGVGDLDSSSPNVMMEIRKINDAFVAEFGSETFTLVGDKSKNDKDVVERFNKVVASYNVSSDFVGHVDFSITSGGESIALHRFENHIYTYYLGWGDMSNISLGPLGKVGKMFHAQLNISASSDLVISGANKAVCDEKVKVLFNQIGSSIKLPDDWTGYAVYSADFYDSVTKETREVASYRFEKK